MIYKTITTHFLKRKHKANVLLEQIKTIKKLLVMKKVFVKGFALLAVVALSFTSISCEQKTTEENVEAAAEEATEAADNAVEAAGEAVDAAATATEATAAEGVEAAAEGVEAAADATQEAAADVKDAAAEATK